MPSTDLFGPLARAVCFFLVLTTLLASYPHYVLANQPVEVYIYSYRSDLESLLRYLDNKPYWNVTVCSLNNLDVYGRYLKIAGTLILSVPSLHGDQINELSGCRKCMELEIKALVPPPLIGFFRNGELLIVTIGVVDPEELDQAFKVKAEKGTTIFTNNGTYFLDDEAAKSRLEELFLNQRNKLQSWKTEYLSNLIMPIFLLALSDSINPCIFTVFTALLLIASYSLSKSKVATIGLSFVSAVFIGYYILGLGLIQILMGVPYLHKITAIMGLLVGALVINRGLKKDYKSPLPKSLRGFMSSLIYKSYAGPASSFLLGLVSSFMLLPCSSGPYIVGLGLLSTLRSFQAYFLLALYNIIFITPLIVIFVAILISKRYSRKVKAFRSKRLNIVEFLSGILLVTICTFILLLK